MNQFQSPSKDPLLNWLEKEIGFETYGHIKPRGLETLRSFVEPYLEEIKKRSIKVITVAGTNGKGETCHCLSSLLSAQGLSWGRFISPHILRVSERIVVNDSEIETEECLQLFEKIKKTATEQNISLSFFEILFFSFLSFALKHPTIQYLILEVGVGGRLDATNLVDTDLALVTSISRDHQALLGSRYEQILKEKLGIIRSNGLLLTNFKQQYLVEQTALYLAQKNVKLKWKNIYLNDFGHHFSKQNRLLALEGLIALGVLTSVREIQHIKKDLLAFVSLPKTFSRGEVILDSSGQSYHLYGSHNPDGIRALVNQLKSEDKISTITHLIFAFSQRPEEDILTMLKILKKSLPLSCEFYLSSSTSWKAAFLNESLLEKMKKIQPDLKVNLAISELVKELELVKNKNILVCGSYYFISDVYDVLV